MPPTQVLAHLRATGTDGDVSSLVITGDGGMPSVAWFGASLDDNVDPVVFSRAVPGGGLDDPAPLGIIAEPSRGYAGPPGIECSRDGRPVSPRFSLADSTVTGSRAVFALVDAHNGIGVEIVVTAHDGGAVTIGSSVSNTGAGHLALHALRVSVPVPLAAAEILTLGGRHAMENVQQRTTWGRTAVTVAGRSGRTGHEQQNVVFVGTPAFGEQRGQVWGAHLAWSGNHETTCNGVTDARRSLHIGELLSPAEVVLGSGDTHCAPMVVLAHGNNGMTGVSRAFHELVRVTRPARTGARPVHLNTWEAVYFRHDLATLTRLADAAARVGIERYVLDDGWFHGRRDDTRGLGDWWVDPQVWPDGLTPLVNHVRALGMEFGLWFEPEMVNPDSDLFRTHPDWALNDPDRAPVLGRNQLVLDMSRAVVRDHLFTAMSAVLSAHDITYVKWDHNRPLTGGAARAQTLGTYELLERLRTAHPGVEFESCASGGGRVDMGIARHVARFWTSDNIDALDRVWIQRGHSMLMPPEMMGAHIGGPVCHTTGRRHTLGFRAATAMFGWLGVEWNILEATDRELDRLASLIELHKQHRDLLHTGFAFRTDHPDPTVVIHGIVSRAHDECMVSITRVANAPDSLTAPVCVPGLQDDSVWSIRTALTPSAWALHRELPAWMTGDGVLTMTGRQLSHVGVNIPPLMPESALLLHLVREGVQR